MVELENEETLEKYLEAVTKFLNDLKTSEEPKEPFLKRPIKASTSLEYENKEVQFLFHMIQKPRRYVT